MKKEPVSSPNKSVRALRMIICKTQLQFAAIVGVSKDTVKSWEQGRNRLKPNYAKKIAVQTGASIRSLIEGSGKVLTNDNRPYCSADYENWKNGFSGSGMMNADDLCNYVTEKIRLLYRASTMPDSRNAARLPALHISLLQWIQQSYNDFKLSGPVNEILNKEKQTQSTTMTYGQWRSCGPGVRAFYKFKDDKTKRDKEKLTLTVDVRLAWTPLA